MFRDETVKVEKKVRASWGCEDGVASSSASSSTDASLRQGPAKTKRSSSMASSATSGSLYISTPSPSFASASPISPNSPRARGGSSSPLAATSSPATTRLKAEGWDSSKLPPSIPTDPAELGLTFYVNHYIIGYPDEVRKAEDLSGQTWFQSSSSQTTMAALGLAGMANLHDDKQLQHLSRMKYGEALALTNSALHNPLQNLEAAIKTTVMLALFQVRMCIEPALLFPTTSIFMERSLTAVVVRSLNTRVSRQRQSSSLRLSGPHKVSAASCHRTDAGNQGRAAIMLLIGG